MPEENEIIAKFTADIEQYQKDVNAAAATTGTLDKSVNQVNASTQKFEKQSKGAGSAVSTLSKGLGGVAGLLGITGRLFGVNTDKIEALVFASREFVKVGQDIAKAQKLATAATVTSTAAKVTEEGVTIQLTVAERILNAVRAAGALGIGLVVAGVTALGVAIYSYIQGLNEEEKALKRKADIDKEQVKINSQLTESYNARAKVADETALAEGVRTGLITERQAEEIKLNEKFFKQREADDKIIAEQRINAAKANNDAFGRLTQADQKRIEENRLKLLKAAEADYDTELKALREKFAQEDADNKKKESEKSLAEREASLQREFNAFVKYWDEVDRKNREAQKAIIKENEQFERNKQKLIEDEFVEEQDSAAKNRALAIEARKKREAEEEEERKANIDKAKEYADIIFKAQQEAFDKRQALLKEEQTAQEKNIDVQRDLAARGLENTLAFEQKRAAELQRQQQRDVQKQKRVKLLETFLNSLAEFSKTDPKTAINKALLQVALATAATAVFAEEGGIIGEIGERSNLSRKHKGGGDVLLHAQTGEGILSRREMDNLGKRNFHLLKDAARFPIRDDVFGMPKIAMMGGSQVSNESVVKELKALQHIIRNKRESTYDLDQFGNYMKTTMENGVKEVIKGKIPKPRFRG